LAGGPPRVVGRAWSRLASTWPLTRKVNIAGSAIAGDRAGEAGRVDGRRRGRARAQGEQRQRRDRATPKLMGGSRTAGGSRSESSGSGNRGNSSFRAVGARFPDEDRRSASALEKRTNSSGEGHELGDRGGGGDQVGELVTRGRGELAGSEGHELGDRGGELVTRRRRRRPGRRARRPRAAARASSSVIAAAGRGGDLVGKLVTRRWARAAGLETR